MRLANHDGRALLLEDDHHGVDVHTASAGRFGPSLSSIYADWTAFTSWATEAEASAPLITIDRAKLGAPSPAPGQILAIGLNYREHATESGFTVPDGLPPVFTKFASAITGPDSVVTLPAEGNTDWEVELVAVVGTVASRVSEQDAWDHVAGLTIGQDLSERTSQLAGPAPQFSLGKSFAGFAPMGPWLTTTDELNDRDDLELSSTIDGIDVQRGRTRDLLLSVPQLISRLSHVVTLNPGDIIFTGTPAGVGMGRTPARYLKAGEHLVTRIEGLGELNQTFVDETPA